MWVSGLNESETLRSEQARGREEGGQEHPKLREPQDKVRRVCGACKLPQGQLWAGRLGESMGPEHTGLRGHTEVSGLSPNREAVGLPKAG